MSLIPWWLKLAIGLAVVSAVAGLIWLPFHWKGQRDVLQNWQTVVIGKVAQATGAKKLTPDKTLIALDALIAERDQARTELGRISRQIAVDKARSDAHDLELEREQAANERKLESAKRQIAQLQARKPTGDAAADLALITADSEAAWKGWQ